MRQPMMTGGQPAPMMTTGMGAQIPTQQMIIPQQHTQFPTEQQNGKNNNVQLDPFGAF